MIAQKHLKLFRLTTYQFLFYPHNITCRCLVILSQNRNRHVGTNGEGRCCSFFVNLHSQQSWIGCMHKSQKQSYNDAIQFLGSNFFFFLSISKSHLIKCNLLKNFHRMNISIPHTFQNTALKMFNNVSRLPV
jgi:hypothetical protein